MHRNKIGIIACLLALLSLAANADDNTRQVYEDAAKRAEEMQSQITPPEQFNADGTRAAERLAEAVNSKAFQDAIEAEKERINAKFYAAHNKKIFEHNGIDSQNLSEFGKLTAKERIYILVSSSIPKETLRNYVKSVDQLQDGSVVLVLRGFIGRIRDYKPTVEYITSLLKKDPNCDFSVESECEFYKAEFNVDPLVYRKFGVTEVPAIVYADNVLLDDPDMSIGSEGNLKGPLTSHIVYGDVSLQYALERLAKLSGNSNLEQMAKKLDGGFHNGQN